MDSRRIVIIANASQTIDETLEAFKFHSRDRDTVEKNNNLYMQKFEEMIPLIDGQRREIIDSVNFFRSRKGLKNFINEHNSSALNGIYLYQFLTENGYRDRVDLIDNIDLNADAAEKAIREASVAVISTTFITSAATIVRLAGILRSWNPEIRIVAGGAKLTQIFDERELYEPARALDALILSAHGQSALLELLDRFRRGEGPEGVPNVAYYDNGFRRNPAGEDTVPMKDCAIKWDLLPDSIIKSSVNVQTGRGCPFKCKFCTFPRYNSQKIDLKPMEVIFDELARINSLSRLKSVRFVDDTLFLNKRRLIEFCRKMIDMEFRLPWTAYLRVSTITKETAGYLARAGCNLVLLGVEATDQKILDNMRKGTREEENWNAAKHLAQVGILAYAFILVGFPGETRETVKKNIDYLNNSGVHAYVHSPLFVFPNTTLSLEADSFGLTGGFNDWQHPGMSCSHAIEYSMEIFESVTGAAYIDRGSTVTKILLDHDFGPEEVKRLGTLHNRMAKAGDEHGDDYRKLRDQFEEMSTGEIGEGGEADKHGRSSSPYSRLTGIKSEIQIDYGQTGF